MDKNKIRKNVVEYLSEDYQIPKFDVDKIFCYYISDEDFTPREEYKTEYLDEDKLFGQTPSFISKYLSEFEQKFGKGTVEQRWSGYEDNYFVYQYKGVEDDETVENRIYKKVQKEVVKYIRVEEQKLAKEKKIKELEKELTKLKRDSCDVESEIFYLKNN